MKIKRYFGKTFSEIMARIEKEHGKNAVILHVIKTREPGIMGFFKSPIIEALVSCEENAEQPAPATRALALPAPNAGRPAAPAGGSGHPHNTDRLAFLEKMMDQMVMMQKHPSASAPQIHQEPDDSPLTLFLKSRFSAQGLSHNKIIKLCAVLKKRGIRPRDVYATLEKIFSYFFKNNQPILADMPGNETLRVLLVGPPGAGKTTSMAKLAFHLKLKQQVHAAMVNCDSSKISANSEIKKYGEFSGIPTFSVFSPDEIPLVLRKLSGIGAAFFDSAAASGEDDEQMDLIRETSRVISPHLTILVLDSGSSYPLVKQAAHAFSDFPGLVFLFTKLDQSRAIGTIVNLKTDYKAVNAYATLGRDVLGDIDPIRADWVVQQLLANGKTLRENPSRGFPGAKEEAKPKKGPAVVPFPTPPKFQPGFPQAGEGFVKNFFSVLKAVDEKAAASLMGFFEKTASMGLVLEPVDSSVALKSADGKNEFGVFTRTAVVKFQNVSSMARSAGNSRQMDQYLHTLAQAIADARLLSPGGPDAGYILKKADNRFLSIPECLDHAEQWLKAIEKVVDSSESQQKTDAMTTNG